jgi:hypothetical protein
MEEKNNESLMDTGEAPTINGNLEENGGKKSAEKVQNDAENEEDPIVHEIPVFLSKSLSQQLYLFQVSCIFFHN